jgi:hypothetical protein|tara:strand:- start:173 stop:508 length:336 start_codon:yes stop_codon:yes gene_type:complete
MDIRKKLKDKLSIINDNIVSNLIFTFIKEKNISYSENKNGVFFNVSLLDVASAQELLDYIIQVSDTNTHDIIDQIMIPEKKKVSNVKHTVKPHYIDYDASDLETIIIGFSF